MLAFNPIDSFFFLSASSLGNVSSMVPSPWIARASIAISCVAAASLLDVLLVRLRGAIDFSLLFLSQPWDQLFQIKNLPLSQTLHHHHSNLHGRVLRRRRMGLRARLSGIGDRRGDPGAPGRGVARGARRRGSSGLYVLVAVFLLCCSRRPRRPEAALHFPRERRAWQVHERRERLPHRLGSGSAACEPEELDRGSSSESVECLVFFFFFFSHFDGDDQGRLAVEVHCSQRLHVCLARGSGVEQG